MLSPQEFGGSPLRHPRRGDKVVAAPNGSDCVSGEVVTFGSRDRITINTTNRGVISLPLSRLTWSPRRKAWVCWPPHVLREVRNLERTDEQATMPKVHACAQVGDVVRIGRRTGFVIKLLGSPAPREGMVIQALRGYIVSTSKGPVELHRDAIVYDSKERCWIAREDA